MFEPYKIVTREQYAQFLYNAITKFEKPEIEHESKPTAIPQDLADDDIYYYEGWMESSSVLKNLYLRKRKILLLKSIQNIVGIKVCSDRRSRFRGRFILSGIRGIPEFYGNFTVRGDEITLLLIL